MTQALGNSLQGRSAVGTFGGTGASIDVAIPDWTPRYVRIVNRTGLATMEWARGMAAASAIKTITDGTISEITTLGVTVNERKEMSDEEPSGADRGFTIGADTDVNVSAQAGFWLAYE